MSRNALLDPMPASRSPRVPHMKLFGPIRFGSPVWNHVPNNHIYGTSFQRQNRVSSALRSSLMAPLELAAGGFDIETLGPTHGDC